MRTFVVAVACLIVFGFLAQPLVNDTVPVESDLGKYHLPLRAFYQRCLRNDDSPSWCPDLFCGYHLHGEGQGGFAHPWHRLLYSVLPLTVAFNVEVFVNYPLMLAGAFLFLRRRDFAADAALAGAATFTFSGFCLGHYPHTNAIAIVAHIPWLLWLTDVLWKTKSRRIMALSHLGISLLTGSQILLGYPQYVWFSALAEGTYVLALMGGGPKWNRLAWWLMAKVLGIGIGGAQLLPSLEALRLSPRLGYTREFRGTLSLPPAMGMQLVAPTLFNEFSQVHEYTAYCGVLFTFGLGWLFVRGRAEQPEGGLLSWAMALGGVALVLALGRHTPLFRIYLKVPVIGVFRAPCRYLVLVHLAAAVLVADVVRDLSRGPPAPWRRLGWLVLIPIAASGLAWLHPEFGEEAQPFLADAPHAWQGAGVMIAAMLLFVLAGRGHGWALTLLLALAVADLGHYGLRVLPAYRFVSWQPYLHQQIRPPAIPSERIDVRDVDGNGPTIIGYRLTRGYVGLTPSRTLDYQDEDVLRRAATRWRWDGREWRQLGAAERIRCEHDGEVWIVSEQPGRLVYQVKCPRPQRLLVIESNHPGWQASVDGEPTNIESHDGDFMAINVPAGGHRVLLTFEPASETRGQYLTFASLILAAAAAFFVRPQ